MLTPYVFTSVTRIADLQTTGFDVAELRDQWADGDYIVANVTGKPSVLYKFELTNGRIVEAMEGTPAVGAFGKRAATLEATGDWAAIGDDGSMEALTGAGLFGKALSVAPTLPRLMSLRYSGHVLRDGRKLTMEDFVPPTPETHFAMPVVLLIGTSMSAGKTTTGRIIVHELKRAGFNVAGAKFTGAGRYRDVLAFRDAGMTRSSISWMRACPPLSCPRDVSRARWSTCSRGSLRAGPMSSWRRPGRPRSNRTTEISPCACSAPTSAVPCSAPRTRTPWSEFVKPSRSSPISSPGYREHAGRHRSRS